MEITESCIMFTIVSSICVPSICDMNCMGIHGNVLELVVAYLVVADEGIGRQVPFTFLDRVKEDFKKRYQEGKTDLAVAYSLDQEFGCDSQKKQCCCCF